jgi:hypothetical protein
MSEFSRREEREEDDRGIRRILRALIGRRVVIILESGERLFVRIEAVRDNQVIAACDCRVIFIDIECICAVIAECPEVLRTILREDRGIDRDIC